MPSHILKVAPDRDLYVYWSTIVEAPVAYGDRAWMRDYLIADAAHPYSDKGNPDERLDRADRAGSSALWPSMTNPAYGWDDNGLIYQQQGWLPRHKLGEMVERLDLEQPVDGLLEPLEG